MLEDTKERCSRTEFRDGRQQPIEAFFYSDAMTESMGSTPKVGKFGNQSKPGKQIRNRLFTVQIICGALSYHINISVDQLVKGGANLAIEIQRVAMNHLAQQLANQGQSMPSILNYQFDNCGENKVIEDD